MLRLNAIGALILLYATAGGAEQFATESPLNDASPSVDQVIYKGIVGNLLEAIPLEKKDRVELQRVNAVLGSPLSARSLAPLLGISSPPLMLLGLVWGLWSAAKLEHIAPPASQLPNPLLSALRGSASANAADVRPADDNDPANSLKRAGLDRMPRAMTLSELDAVVGAGLPSPALACDCYQQVQDSSAIVTAR